MFAFLRRLFGRTVPTRAPRPDPVNLPQLSRAVTGAPLGLRSMQSRAAAPLPRRPTPPPIIPDPNREASGSGLISPPQSPIDGWYFMGIDFGSGPDRSSTPDSSSSSSPDSSSSASPSSDSGGGGFDGGGGGSEW